MAARALVAAANAAAMFLLLALASAWYTKSPVLSAALLLAAVDQAVDIYQSATGRNPYPRWLFGLDIGLDAYQVILGIGALLLGLTYLPLLDSPVYPLLFAAAGVLLFTTSLYEVTVKDPKLFGLVRVKAVAGAERRRRVLR
jgi:hypothetical protein